MYVVAKKHDRQPEIDSLREQLRELEEEGQHDPVAIRVVGALSNIDRIYRDGGNEAHLDLAHNELEKALTAYERSQGK